MHLLFLAVFMVSLLILFGLAALAYLFPIHRSQN